MTDWYGDITGEKPAAAAPQRANPDWYLDVINAGQPELRQGPLERMRAAPLVDSPATGASPLAAGVAGLAPDTQGQIKILAKQMGIPEERFGILDGNIVYADEEGRLNRAIPSVFKGGVVETLARMAPWMASQFGAYLPGAVGTVAGVATAPVSGPGSVAAASGAAGLTDVVRQALANYYIGDEGRGIDWLNAGGQAAMAGAGQGISLGASRLLQRNPMGVEAYDRTAAMDPQRRAAAAALEAEARKRGIDLTAGQATGLRSLRAQERQLGRFPETMDRVTGFIETQQRQQIPAAVSREIGNISPARGEAAINQFREGAEAVAERALNARSAQARVAYDRALTKEPFISEELKALMRRPSMKDAWASAQRLAAEEGVSLPKLIEVADDGAIKVTSVPDWRSWDYIKRGLDSVIDANTDAVTGRVNSVGRAVANTRREILGVLDAANPDYAAARAVYGKASDAVEAVLDGGVGLLKKMDGEARRSMLGRIFSGGQTALMPEQVARMRAQFATAGKLDDWNAGVSAYLADALDQATGVRVANVAQDFTARVWGDENKRAVMKAALGNDPAKLAGFEQLMKVLDAARKTLPEGSPTATDVGALSSAVSTGTRVVGKALSPGSYLNLGNEVVEGINALRAPQARIKLAEALLSGNYAKELQTLRLLKPTHEKALQITGQILTRAGVVGVGTATGLSQPADQPIPGFGETR